MYKAVIATQCDRGRRKEASRGVTQAGVVTRCPHECLEGTPKGWTLEMSQGKDIPGRGHGDLKEQGEDRALPGFLHSWKVGSGRWDQRSGQEGHGALHHVGAAGSAETWAGVSRTWHLSSEPLTRCSRHANSFSKWEISWPKDYVLFNGKDYWKPRGSHISSDSSLPHLFNCITSSMSSRQKDVTNTVLLLF